MRVLSFCACILFMLSCGSDVIYERNYDFESGTWSYGNPAQFDFSIDNNASRYDLQLDINHSTDYPFENLYLKIKTEFPDNTSVSDTLSIEMVNKAGAWIGKCSGENCLLKVILQEHTKFKDIGDHTLSFEQFTRREQLDGINSMGFLLIKSNPN